MLIDYHIHNHFSPDSETDTVEIVKREKSLGIKDICITNHSEGFTEGEDEAGIFDYEDAMKHFRAAKDEIDNIRPQFPDMNIGFGVETQYQEGFMDDLERFVKNSPFDFVLGSIHILENVVISGGKHAGDFFEKKDEEKAYTMYFEDMLKLIEWGNFDAVAHFDIIKKYGHEHYGPFQPTKYKPIIQKILQLMKNKGIGIELNTACLYQRCKEIFPHPDILKWCLEIGIENYTLGSDAHELEIAGTYIHEAHAIAKEIGIPEISTYEKRKPTTFQISDL